MKFSSSLAVACLIAAPVLGGEEGLTGFPANGYDPYCAEACLRSISTLTLDCSTTGVTVGMIVYHTSTECFAQNTPFLTTLAWCMHTKCANYHVLASKMEYFWEQQGTGQRSAGVQTVPAKWSYGEALAQITTPPMLQLLATDKELNATALVPPATYLSQYNVLYGVEREGILENTYGIAMLITAFGTPVVLTWAGYLPFVSNLLHRLRPYLIWPSTIGTYQVRPLPYLLGNAPTIGHTMYVVMFIILNIILTSVGYESHQPNAWYSTRWREIIAFVFYRTGNFAYIMAPLVFLFAGRNNILLWMTNWSHSTYLLLHRWVARVFTFQVLLHSILALVLYCEDGNYAGEHVKPYWIWGIVATLCCVVLAFFSGLYVRKFFYESFLIVHIVLSVILIVGCWYHAYDLYGFLGGYYVWIYTISAVWAFDRAARLVRMWCTGARVAKVTELGDSHEYVRIDVPGVRWSTEPGKHAYFYFPTLSPLRPWENHPFSVLPTVYLRPSNYHGKSDRASSQDGSSTDEHIMDMEKRQATTAQVKKVYNRSTPAAGVGLTLFVRRGTGTTRSLTATTNLLTLIEGPYPNNSTTQVLRCDRLLLIGGGIGITALVPFVANHWNVKLCWSVKDSAKCLVDEFEGTLNEVAEKDIRVGSRLDVMGLLEAEVEVGWEKVGVVVSGPGDLCDDVRSKVTQMAKACLKGKAKTVFELEVEAYSW